MANSIGSVAVKVFTRMTGIPSDVSGSMIDLASGAVIDIAQHVGEDISATNIPNKWFNAAINLTALYARVRIDGGAYSFNMDGLSLSKGASPQAEFFREEVSKALKRKKILYKKVYG